MSNSQMSGKNTTSSTGRSYSGLTAAERKEQRREKFLEAGLQIFGTQGYRAGTVRALCKEAGLTDRYFYESFPDTEALLLAVYHRNLANLTLKIMDKAEQFDVDFEQQIRLFANIYLDHMRDPRVAKVVFIEVLGVSPKVDAIYRDHATQTGAMIMRQIGQQLPELVLDQEEEAALGAAIAGASVLSAAQWMLSGYKAPQETIVDAFATTVMGITNQLATRIQ